jgi:hypothetical protein
MYQAIVIVLSLLLSSIAVKQKKRENSESHTVQTREPVVTDPTFVNGLSDS